MNSYIGIDVGGTNTVLGLIDSSGKYILKKSIRTFSSEPFSTFIKNLDNEIKSLINQNGYQAAGIGIGVPGANIKTGFVEAPENFNWGQIDLLKIFQDKYKVPIKIINDADAAALGEIYFGTAKNLKNFLHITLGTGVGNSTIVNGKIIIGHNGLAGELGHTKVYPDNRMCSCGKMGCLETYVSANGIRRTVFELLSADLSESVLRGISFNETSPRKVTKLAKEGDLIAIKAYQITGKILGEKIANVIGLLNPEAIVFSGGIVAAGEFLFEPMKIAIEKNLLRMHKNTVEIRLSDPNSNLAVLGAASVIMKSEQFENVEHLR